jgi:putative peptide zinc metalloprotease protein
MGSLAGRPAGVAPTAASSETASAASNDALPRLRDELRIERAAPLADGAPCWTLIDSVAHRYFQLGQRELELLRHWKLGTGKALAVALQQRGAPLGPQELKVFTAFLVQHGLVELDTPQTSQHLQARAQAQRSGGLTWLLHHYLFFRIPLLRPQALLRRTLPWARQLWSPAAWMALAALGLLGGYLVSRQWDAFVTTFAEMLSWRGLLSYLAAAVLVKTAHEFGHAYVATHFGCRVPTMGVAVMMGLPMLYSDTTASWRLTSRRARVLIDAAGVLAELQVAVLATVLWAFLPDGAVRGAVFVLATSSWMMSLAVNLNPFMRFDGYYLLSDALGQPNLQPRAFALAQWHLREVLLGLGAQVPEPLTPSVRRGMILYAWATWVYRVVLYAGIALAVYHAFFKLLGLVLFAVEVGWFLVRPAWTELRLWWGWRAKIGQSWRARWMGVGLAGLLLLGVLPLDRSVSLPAVLAPTQEVPLFPPAPAQIIAVLVRDGQQVQQGQVLMRLASPMLVHEQALAQTRLNLARARLNRIAGAPRELAQALVLARDVDMHQRALQSLNEQQALLEIRAPFDGRLLDVDAGLHAGRWVDRQQVLGRVVSGEQLDLRAYVPETHVWRLAPGQTARFLADDARLAPLDARVAEIAGQASQTIDLPLLSATYDGPIAIRDDVSSGLKPLQAQYHVRLTPDAASLASATAKAGVPRQIVGSVHLEAEPQSWLSTVAAQILRVLAREADL